MRTLSVLIAMLAAACEHQPPKKKPPPPVATTPADAAAPAPPDVEPAGSGSATGSAAVAAPPIPALVDAGAPAPVPDALETSATCNEIGVHLAATMIAEAQDPAQKAALQQERTRIVRRTAEACTRDRWSEASQKCFLKAKTAAEMQICGRELAAPKE